MLREIRKAKGMTQTRLAAAAGVTQQALSAIETGKATPSVATARRLAAALGCEWWQLLESSAQLGNAQKDASAGGCAPGRL